MKNYQCETETREEYNDDDNDMKRKQDKEK